MRRGMRTRSAATSRSRAGHGASAGRREAQPPARLIHAARIPVTAEGLPRCPERTRSRASSRSTQARGRCASSASPVRGRPLRERRQPSGQEDPDALGRAARGRVEVQEDVPAGGLVPGLLGQLPACGQPRGLVGLVQESCRRLEQPPPDGMAVLADEQDAVVVVESDDRHRPRMEDDVADGRGTLELDGVADDRPHPALEPDGAISAWAGIPVVRDRPGPLLGSGHPWASASRCRSEATSAAPIRPANRGWARVGRDRNSGCAWVPT